MSARLCRNCGQPIHTDNRIHGRSASRALWHVHTATDRVPCEPDDIRAHRAAQRASGHTRAPDRGTQGTQGTPKQGPTHLEPQHETDSLIQGGSNLCPSRPSSPVCPLFERISTVPVSVPDRPSRDTTPDDQLADLIAGYFL